MIKYDVFMAGQTKEKIAITIDEKLLSRVDKMIDGETIRNRSHAIEYLVTQSLRPKVKKALICAGETIMQKGVFIPAALLPFEEKPKQDLFAKMVSGCLSHRYM